MRKEQGRGLCPRYRNLNQDEIDDALSLFDKSRSFYAENGLNSSGTLIVLLLIALARGIEINVPERGSQGDLYQENLKLRHWQKLLH